ncbi:MAG: hypothetical protein ABI721_00625 [Candidatus Dojkabacteria bacterium]
MFIFEFLSLMCFGVFVVFSVAIIYYLFVLKEKGQLKYKQFQDLFDELSGTKKAKKVTKQKKSDNKPQAEDAEFREVK